MIFTRGANTIEAWAKRGTVNRAVLFDVESVLRVEDVDYCPGTSVAIYTGFMGWYAKRSDTNIF